MRAIIRRLRRLEEAVAPEEQDNLIVQAILEARRRRLGADYEPTTFPPESYAGCRTVADRILRSRWLRMEHQQSRGAR